MKYEHLETYRNFLKDELVRSRFNERQVAYGLAGFDKLALVSGPELSFRIMHESYANSDTDKAINTIRGIIQQGLDKLNREHPGVCTDARSRLRAVIERFNKNLDACSIEINGVPLSREEIDKEKIRIPGHLGQVKNHVRYSATAKLRSGKTAKLILEVF